MKLPLIFFILAACTVLAGVIHDYRFKADKKATAKAHAEWMTAFNERTAQENLMQQHRHDAIQREADARKAELDRQQQEADALEKRKKLWMSLQP
jgi:hypothetical protein